MSPSRLQLFFVLSLVATGVICAQTETYTVNGFQDLPPPPRRAVAPAMPELSFGFEAEIPLPGPLPGSGPRLRGESVEIAVAGGTMLTRPISGAQPELLSVAETREVEADPSAWVFDDFGQARYRALPGGTIEAQRRCRRCKTGWKRRWRLRVPGSTVAPPLVTQDRVYFGALDNRVYCVKARSGHRVWVTDVGGRVSTRLVRWRGRLDPTSTQELQLILAVPDGGAVMIGLEGREGQPLASVRLPNGSGKLVSSPLAMPQGLIVVARQDYAESKAALLVYSVLELSHDSKVVGRSVQE